MGNDYEDRRVIKPPIEHITSGKLFKPSKAFRNKWWFIVVFSAFIFWIIVVGIFYLVTSLIGFIDEGVYAQYFLDLWWEPINFWYAVISVAWLIPALIFIPIYVNSISYSVRAESGESMPEVYVRKGIIDITEKHVPFRTITNIASKTGPFDRLFKIGSIEIETAGFSGATVTGPEEKIEGIVFYEELRDFILKELRKLQGTYVTGTEVSSRLDGVVPTLPDSLDDEILITLREILRVLHRMDEKLDRQGR
ncbi:MAG: PH domain-containing protein [Candidatus Thorarchaeota archaeon]|jgi:membrane protein YdbS with pleckstrin-like domain